MTEIKFVKSKQKTGWMVALCSLLFVALLLAYVAQWVPNWVFGLATAVLVLGFIANLLQYLDNRPYLILNEQGLYAPESWPEIIPWNLIKSADIRSYPNFNLLTIDLHKESKMSDDRGETARQAIRIQTFNGQSDISIILTNMNWKKKEVLALINQRINA